MTARTGKNECLGIIPEKPVLCDELDSTAANIPTV